MDGGMYAKALSEGGCVGLEFGGVGCADAMREMASNGGFAMLTDPNHYAEWRYMGVEGGEERNEANARRERVGVGAASHSSRMKRYSMIQSVSPSSACMRIASLRSGHISA